MNFLRKYAAVWYALAWVAYSVTVAIVFCHLGPALVFAQGVVTGVWTLSAARHYRIARWGR